MIVRVNRLLLLAVLGIGILLFWFGSDVLIFKQTFTGNSTETIDNTITVTTEVNNNLIWLSIIPLILGAIVIYTITPYLLKPPVMLQITEREIRFGTNVKYEPYSIARQHVKQVRLGSRGVVIEFNQHSDVPAQLTTSAGIMYRLHQLSISQLYMNKSATSVIQYLNDDTTSENV